MQELISALEKTIEFLKNSTDSDWAAQSVSEAKETLEKELETYKQKQKFSFLGKGKIKFLFLPTGTLQEISLDNGWSSEYLQISEIIDKYTK